MGEVIVDGTGGGHVAEVTSDNRLKVEADLTVSDIEIGAVEIKDGTTDQRAIVNEEGQLHVVLMGKVDDGNSTTTPLNSGAVFTGTAFDTLDYGFIFVTIFSDVASATDGLSFQQSSDGTNWDNTDDFNYLAGTGKTYSIQPGAKWFRIVYTNGGTNQATFRLSTLFKKTSSLPSSHRLSDNLSVEDDATLGISVIKGQKPDGDYVDFNATAGGNFKVSLEEFDETFDNKPLPVKETATTAFGDLRTAELHSQFQGSFEYTVDNTDLNTNIVLNGGTMTQASGMGVATTSTTTLSSALLESKQHARYKSGLGGLSRFTALFTSPVTATEQYIGLGDETGSSAAFNNGYMVGYDGTTFGFHRFQNDTKITVAQASWDDPMDGTGSSGMTLDQTKLNVFAIQYQYLGAGAIRLFIESDTTGEFILVHTIDYANNNIEPSTHNPNFHHIMWVDNKSTTSNLILKSSSYAYFVEGKTQFIELHQPEFATGIQEKTTVTSEVAILTIRNKTSYVSKTNFIDIHIQGIASSIEASSANNLANIRVIKNTTLGGTPSYSDINTSNSVVEIDTSGTTITGGQELISVPLAGKNDKEIRDIVNLRLLLNPGETITIAGSSLNSATIRAGILWRELF